MTDGPVPAARPAAAPPLLPGPVGGALGHRASVLLWGVGTILLGLTVAILLVNGEIRTLTLLLLSVLGVLCLAPRRGIYIILTFLPFMYFLRRQVLYFNAFSQRDPILLFPPIVTIAMSLGFLIFYSEKFYYYVRHSLLLRLALALQVLYCVQIFNPLQGSVLVGLGGAMYFVIPMLWMFMGLLIDGRDVRRIFSLVMTLGAITALYGTYQHYFGMTGVEVYEMESKEFLKGFGDKPRVMSTFAGIGDFSVYLSVTGSLAFAHYWRTKKNATYLALLGIVVFALLWVASRTSVLVLVFAIATYLIVRARRPELILARGLLATLVIGALYGYLYTMSPQDVWRAYRSNDPFIVHTVSGVVHPTEEQSFQSRLRNWTYVTRSGLTEYPFGRGLGSTTTAALKFGTRQAYVTDSYFFELIYGSGLLAAILFIAMVLLYVRDSMRLLMQTEENFTYSVVVALMSAFFLGSVFGMDLRDPITAPLAWLLLGWTIREVVDRTVGSVELEPGVA